MVSIQYLVEVSLCWLVSYGCYQLWLSQETFFSLNRFYLLISLGLGLLLPLLSFSTLQATASDYTVYYTLHEVVIGVDSTIQNANTDWLWYGYLAGVLFFLGRFIKDLIQIYLLAKRANIAKKDNHYYVETAITHPPFSFFQWLFLSQQPELAAADKQYIIEHELAHIQHWHSLDILLVELLTILFWFNPLLQLFQTALKEVHEYAADKEVLRSTPVKNYGHLLLQQAFPNIELRLIHNFNQSQLKKRIKMMTKKPSTKGALLKYMFVAPVLIAISIFFSAYTFSNAGEATIKGEVDQMPYIKKCKDTDAEAQKNCSNKELFTFVYTNVKYPEAARKAGKEGMAVIGFTVSKKGKVTDLKIVKDPGNGLGEAALVAVQALANSDTAWEPGRDKGKKVAVEMKLPVKFKLE